MKEGGKAGGREGRRASVVEILQNRLAWSLRRNKLVACNAEVVESDGDKLTKFVADLDLQFQEAWSGAVAPLTAQMSLVEEERGRWRHRPHG
jgi:hypothetical protein